MMSPKEIEIITNLLNKDMECLEWGSGYSTLYFGKMVKSWLSIEHNKEWFDLISSQIRDHKIKVEMKDDYLDINKKFDFILIDGIRREECFRKAHELIKPNGIILLHDASRREYKDWIDTSELESKELIKGEIEDRGYYLHRGLRLWKGKNE